LQRPLQAVPIDRAPIAERRASVEGAVRLRQLCKPEALGFGVASVAARSRCLNSVAMTVSRRRRSTGSRAEPASKPDRVARPRGTENQQVT